MVNLRYLVWLIYGFRYGLSAILDMVNLRC